MTGHETRCSAENCLDSLPKPFPSELPPSVHSFSSSRNKAVAAQG